MPKAQILNVDDYAPGRYARSRILKQAGYTIAEAGTGEEALRFVNEIHPQLVVLDVNLPDINGLEVCQRIKANPDTASTAVLQVSAARIQNHHLVEGLNSGADSYLVEPVEPSVLLATVRSLLRARQAEEALRRSNEDLKHFAYMVSHELNEPLRMITSYTQLLAHRYRGKLDSDADDFINFTTAGAARMKDFLGDLLKYSQAVNVDHDFHPCSCEVVLGAALANLHVAIGEAAAEITHDPLPDVCGNELQLTHVFQNLIGNAVKYRRKDVPLQVHISSEPTNGMRMFSVADNGIGIDSQYFDQIFGIFKRLHGRDVAGTGIGLALCKRIIEAHGGEIWVESKAGTGSTFRFTLPNA
jgi:signal transduction histidine kinase